MHAKTTVIHGGPATGKTRFAKKFQQHHGCNSIFEEWDPSGCPRQREHPQPGALVLTQCAPDRIRHYLGPVRIICVEDALSEIGK